MIVAKGFIRSRKQNKLFINFADTELVTCLNLSSPITRWLTLRLAFAAVAL